MQRSGATNALEVDPNGVEIWISTPLEQPFFVQFWNWRPGFMSENRTGAWVLCQKMELAPGLEHLT